MLNRRLFLSSVGMTAVCACVGADGASTEVIEEADMAKSDQSAIPDYDKWQLTNKEWKQRLSPEAYAVLRKEGTERPWTSPLNDEKRDGVYACAGCGFDLFNADKKFDSGTGWPSYSDFIPGSLRTKRDFKLLVPRTEYHCARCGGHQGHVFDDGPKPTGLRYCNNGVALSFKPA